MIFGKTKQRRGKAAGQNRAAADARIHSMAALLRERHFSGSFDVAGASYRFTYAPSKAELAEGRLQLKGRLTITDPQGRARMRDPVKALLASTQGGIGRAPARPSIPGVEKREAGQSQATELPAIESTGPLSFCGVIYFRLEPINGRSLGVPADLSRVQLNARLTPTEETGRKLHGFYSFLVEAIYGSEADHKTAETIIEELNKFLAAR